VDATMTGRARDNAMTNVIQTLSRNDPVKAAWYVSSLPYGRVDSGAESNIARNWGGQDAQGALNWAYGLDEGE